jgi:P-type E1-E2 ATPase
VHLTGDDTLAHTVWALVTIAGLAGALVLVGSSVRAGRLGVDVVAVLALTGTLAVHEYLAGAVVSVMLASGRTLEARASARSKRELRLLIERAPRVAHRIDDGVVTSLSLENVAPGDLLLVKPGEVVPVDGRLELDAAVLDESALTGEPLPVERGAGDVVRSGAVNAGGPFTFRVTTRAADSTYAGIVRLVAEADATSSPFVRVADRYAAVFLGTALGAAALAWFVSGDLVRAVAVLVVATPCPFRVSHERRIEASSSKVAVCSSGWRRPRCCFWTRPERSR